MGLDLRWDTALRDFQTEPGASKSAEVRPHLIMRLVRMILVPCGLEHLNQRKKDLMISNISRAACLAELTSNPKSFFNCPDLHGGVPGLPGDRIWVKPALGKERVVPLAVAVLVA